MSQKSPLRGVSHLPGTNRADDSLGLRFASRAVWSKRSCSSAPSASRASLRSYAPPSWGARPDACSRPHGERPGIAIRLTAPRGALAEERPGGRSTYFVPFPFPFAFPLALHAVPVAGRGGARAAGAQVHELGASPLPGPVSPTGSGGTSLNGFPEARGFPECDSDGEAFASYRDVFPAV